MIVFFGVSGNNFRGHFSIVLSECTEVFIAKKPFAFER